MASQPSDETIQLTDDFSHVNLDNLIPNTAEPGPSNYFNAQAAPAAPDTYLPNTLGFDNTSDASALPTNTEQLDPSQYPNHPPIDPEKPFICYYPNKNNETCFKGYRRACDLTKHQKNHKRDLICVYCPEGFPEQKDRDRHYVTHHSGTPEAAKAKNKAKASRSAICSCGYDGNGRPDNVKRHRDKLGHD